MEEKEDKKITKEKIKITIDVIVRYLKMYKKEIVFLSIFTVVSALGNGTIPYITGKFFDSIIKPGNTVSILQFTIPLFAFLLVLWFVVQIISNLVDLKISKLSISVGEYIWTDYMANGFGKIILLPITFFKENNSSSAMRSLDMAGSSIQNIVSNTIIKLTPNFLSILVSLVICYFINPFLTCILIFGLVFFSIVMNLSIKPLANIQKEFYKKFNELWRDFSGVLDNIKTVKNSNSEKYESNRMEKLCKGWALPAFLRRDFIRINVRFYQNFIIVITQFLIFCFSLSFVFKGQMTIGNLLAFNAYTALAFGPLVQLGYNWQDLINGIVNIFETEKILSAPKEDYQPKGFIKLSNISGHVIFHNVDFYYDVQVPVLKDVSFEAKPGEVIALVGESGVGKSTLIDMLTGYYFPQKGDITIDSVSIKKIDLDFLRKNVGIVPQEVVLFNDTIKKNFSYGSFDISDDELTDVAEKIGIFEFIEKLPKKWETIVGERGIKLSVGQKQRMAIARAMLRNPKILILDEPTSALDARSEKVITDSLEELMKGKTTFIVAHRLSTVRRADTILVFKDGEIIERGKHDELLKIKDGEYRKLYELQIGLHK